jgi:hypothetical protein
MIGPDVPGKMSEVNSERKIAKELAGELLRLGRSERSDFLTAIANDPEAQQASGTDPKSQRVRISEMFLGLIAANKDNEDRVQSALQDVINSQTAQI